MASGVALAVETVSPSVRLDGDRDGGDKLTVCMDCQLSGFMGRCLDLDRIQGNPDERQATGLVCRHSAKRLAPLLQAGHRSQAAHDLLDNVALHVAV